MANDARFAQFLYKITDLGSNLEIDGLRECGRALLKLMPAGILVVFIVCQAVKTCNVFLLAQVDCLCNKLQMWKLL